MPVVVNEFEVVPGGEAPAPSATPAAGESQQQQHQPDPTKAEEELVRSLRRLEARALRLHAS
jgi:hypothetical protein